MTSRGSDLGQGDLLDLIARHGSQRWGRRSCSWRPGAEVFDPSIYGVEVIPGDAAAREFVEAHHYSGSYPAARLRVGLYRLGRAGGAELVGVAVLSVPANQRVVPSYLPGLEPHEGVELGRLVLLDEVPSNGETWFLARVWQAVRSELPDVRGVVSYSDPVPRRTVEGEVVMPGHIGVIYQAHNGAYLGRGSARTLLLDRAGRCVNGRLLSKIRREERGIDYACRALADASGLNRRVGEDGAAYVARVVASGELRRVRHPGNHVYAWGLDRRMRSALGAGEDYPR